METKQALRKEGHRGFSSPLGDLAWEIVLAAIVVVVGLNILTNLQSSQTANSTAYNASGKAITAVGGIPDWFTLLVLVGVAVVIIFYLNRVRNAGNMGG